MDERKALYLGIVGKFEKLNFSKNETTRIEIRDLRDSFVRMSTYFNFRDRNLFCKNAFEKETLTTNILFEYYMFLPYKIVRESIE